MRFVGDRLHLDVFQCIHAAVWNRLSTQRADDGAPRPDFDRRAKQLPLICRI
jgi:hypothetical protein